MPSLSLVMRYIIFSADSDDQICVVAWLSAGMFPTYVNAEFSCWRNLVILEPLSKIFLECTKSDYKNCMILIADRTYWDLVTQKTFQQNRTV